MPSPKQRNKTRRLQRLANEDIESQLLGKFKLNSDLQLARFAKNNYREDLIIEYKDHQKKSQKFAKSIIVDFNSNTYIILKSDLEQLFIGKILEPEIQLTVKKIVNGRDLDDNSVHKRIFLEFTCGKENCQHSIVIHLYHTKQRVHLQGDIIHDKYSVPYYYLHTLFIPYVDACKTN